MRNLTGARVFGYTHGCRLNACETDAMTASVVSSIHGAHSADAGTADIIIVNTCTVTGRSGARCRKAVKGFRNRNPEALIIVTGCASEISPGDFQGVKNCIVIGNTEKASLPGMLSGKPVIVEKGLFPGFVSVSAKRTRSFLKIQDGCDNSCTYCIVPRARGASRSQPRETVLSQALELAALGKREICLVGVDLADYGKDLYSEEYRLSHLVRDLLKLGGFRVRLSSLEPNSLSVSTLERLCLPGVCRHFHIPLQSGSARVLSAMGRRYDRSDEERLLSAVHRLFPGASVGADIIAGFPGETEDEFAETLSLAESGLLSYLHVFPYSRRPGTPAAALKGLHTEVVTERANILRSRSELLRRRFRESMIGERGIILVEGRRHRNRRVGLTDNYIPVAAPPGAVEGELVEVTLGSSNICWDLR